jgi:cell shape-determining protein MreD
MGVLAVRLLDDVVRIVEAEVKLVEVNFGSALTASLDRAVGRFLAALLLFLGASCLLAGLIMLLRHWLEMWQALAVAGAAAFAAAFTVAWIAGRIASSAESQLTKS